MDISDGVRRRLGFTAALCKIAVAVPRRLRNGTTYWFRVAATNAAGRIPWTTSVKVAPIDNRKPGAASIDAVTACNHAVGLRWSQPVDTGGLPIANYVVQIGLRSVWRNVAFVSGGTRAYTATGLVDGPIYYFRVRAANSLGWSPSWSNTVRAVPVAPPPPAPPPPTGMCDPNHSGCVPIDYDVDCAGGSGNGPSYVRGPVYVIGHDVYDLDGYDNDGIGCE